MTVRGGKRDGAGRKKGAANKASQERQRQVAATGITPLDYILNTMRDENNPLDVRFEAAKAAAPYVHPKLASVEHAGKGGGAIIIAISSEDAEL